MFGAVVGGYLAFFFCCIGSQLAVKFGLSSMLGFWITTGVDFLLLPEASQCLSSS